MSAVRRLPWAVALSLLAAAGCGRYTDFTLPQPDGRSEPGLRFEWRGSPAPVLARGAPGDFDSADALNPAVIADAGQYWNLYSGFDGKTWRTGLATSTDGLSWKKQGPLLSPSAGASSVQSWEGDYIAANGAVLRIDGEFLYWYQAGRAPRIGLARWRDGRRIAKLDQPVLDHGPRGSWDERGVADPYMIRRGGRFFMFYLGQDRARRQRLGVALSDDGVRWRKLRSNPVLELGDVGSFDERGLGEPAVWTSHGAWWMLYTGRDTSERRRLGLAQSLDGVRWRKWPDLVIAGDQPWNSQVVCDPDVEVRDQAIRVWYGGGDRARPDENLNGQIGVGSLAPVRAAGIRVPVQ